MTVGDLGTILGVWAHPDDECYLSAGLMARAARAGAAVAVAMATRGEGGSVDPVRWPPERMAEIREKELAAALGVLGVTDIRWLDYVDGTCHAVDDGEAVDKLIGVIEEVRPDTVLTFGPEGMTGHSDHIAVSRWTTTAFWRAGNATARLMYATTTREWVELMYEELQRYDVYMPGTPPVHDETELAIDLELTDELLEAKFRALRHHASQIGWWGMFEGDLLATGFRHERYWQAPRTVDDLTAR
jgi:LmbE family N-acetylglucosaminyl deacetylase